MLDAASFVTQVFLPAVLSGGVVGAVVSALFKFWDNRQLHQQKENIEALKSRLRQMEDQSKVRFNWLHRKRAEAAAEVYGKVIEVDAALSQMLTQFTHYTPDDEEKTRLLKAAVTTGDDFRRQYANAGLFLPDEVVEQLLKLDDELWKKFILARIHGQELSIKDREALFRESDFKVIRQLTGHLRVLLRKVLGIVEEDARNLVSRDA